MLRILASFNDAQRLARRAQTLYEEETPVCLFPPHTKACLRFDAALARYGRASTELYELAALASYHRRVAQRAKA